MDITKSFVYSSNSPKVLFGSGAVDRLADELRLLNAASPLVVSSPSRVSLAGIIKVKLSLSGITNVEILDTAIVHNPNHLIAPAVDRANGRDVLISVGGGSAVGLAKAVALRTGLPHIAIPTTYSGSEMTQILGETKDGKKTSTSDSRILPKVVIYDVNLTMDLPTKITGPSGVNAIAHSFEALYAQHSNPISSATALESIKALSSSLPAIVSDPSSVEARTSALYGAFLAGLAVASTGIALHHKLAHAVGGTLNLPHAETHSILLPHSIAYNGVAIPGDMLKRLSSAFSQSSEDSLLGIVIGLNKFIRQLGIPIALKDLGMKEGDLDRVADVALETPYWNPRTVQREKVREILRRAWAGEEARPDF